MRVLREGDPCQHPTWTCANYSQGSGGSEPAHPVPVRNLLPNLLHQNWAQQVSHVLPVAHRQTNLLQYFLLVSFVLQTYEVSQREADEGVQDLREECETTARPHVERTLRFPQVYVWYLWKEIQSKNAKSTDVFVFSVNFSIFLQEEKWNIYRWESSDLNFILSVNVRMYINKSKIGYLGVLEG